ncbi:MAG: PEP-CTERM sorting domain-containing protein [Verrucomicrobiota bacterium]
MKNKTYLVVLVASLGAHSLATAALTSTNQTNGASNFFDSGITSSLVTVGAPSLASVNASTPHGFSVLGLNDGAANVSGAGLTWYYQNSGKMPATITFQLTAGYDITSIASLSGWGNTASDGAYFGSQQFQLSLETGFSGTYVPYANPEVITGPTGISGHFGYSTFSGNNTFSTLTTITDTAGPIATNVTGIRFVFVDPYPTTGIPDHGTVIRELSVFGTATPVPEPSTLLVTFSGLIGVVFLRRRN